MADLLIRFRRPGTMDDAEARAWLARRARAWRPGSALTRSYSDEEARLRVKLAPGARSSTEDYLVRMLMRDAN
jgi:hypothetical protein